MFNRNKFLTGYRRFGSSLELSGADLTLSGSDRLEYNRLTCVANSPLPRYDGPEPQYAETKSSILRRRNSKAKLNNSYNGKLSDVRSTY